MMHRLLRITLALAAIAAASGAPLARAEDEPVLHYAPDDTDALVSVDFAAIGATPAAAALVKSHPDLEAKLDEPVPGVSGLKLRSLSAFQLAQNVTTEDYVLVIKAGVKLNAAEAFSGRKPSETIGRYVLYPLDKRGISGTLVDDRTMVLSKTEILRAALLRDRPARISAQMMALRRSIPSNRQIFAVVETPRAAAVRRLLADPANDSRELAGTIKWAVGTVDIDERIALRASVECADAAIAGRVSHNAIAFARSTAFHPTTPARFVANLEHLNVTADGTNVAVRLDVDLDALVEMYPPRLIFEYIRLLQSAP
jgi:hypothetical protein